MRFSDKNRKNRRLNGWNYAWKGDYYITIVTQNREHSFGEIIDGVMFKSYCGERLEYEWLKTPSVRPDMNLTLGVHQVMPNHFHGIITIGKNIYNSGENPEEGFQNSFGSPSKTLGSVIRGIKSSVKLNMQIENISFKWQSNFHDHIIRNNIELFKIRKYILNNVANWKKDRFNDGNTKY